MLNIDKEFDGLSCLISSYGVLGRSRGSYVDISGIDNLMDSESVFEEIYCEALR